MPYIDPEQIERVKRIDLLSYLERFNPDELVRIGASTYCTKTHDSLKISNNKWYWWSRGFGGKSALDYLIKVEGMSFLAAAQLLGAAEITPTTLESAKPAPTKQAHKVLQLPRAAETNDAAIGYLRLRGISKHVISECIRRGLLYAAIKGARTNVVFVGKSKDGHVRYASLRATSRDFKGEAAGSDKRFSFRLNAQIPNDTVHIFEGAIDALTYATLVLESDRDWREMNLLSLGGVPTSGAVREQTRLPQALTQYLSDNPNTCLVHLHLDNDEPGIAAANMIAAALTLRNIEVTISPPPVGKDISEYLQLKRKPEVVPEMIPLNETRLAKTMKSTDPKKKERVR